MTDRFAQLLAKGKASALTKAEREELAWLLNAPILGDDLNRKPAYVAKSVQGLTDLTVRVKSIPWFSRCGQPVNERIPIPITPVKTWATAMESCSGHAWGDIQLEASNQLTEWLHHNARDRYQDWNKEVERRNKETITPLEKSVWVPFQKQHALPDNFIHCLQWDLLAALMESAYFDTGHSCFFFLELLTVYEAGHFPCGWGGEWPDGNLMVY